MELIIISPNGVLLNEATERVTLPGSMGAFTVLKSHAPLVSTLEKGPIVYLQNKKEKNYNIEGGVTVVEKNVVRVMIE
jgi:F0F1-type ATP synthase, epsilon subunit (mitochondrial delta subunit)